MADLSPRTTSKRVRKPPKKMSDAVEEDELSEYVAPRRPRDAAEEADEL